METALRNAAYGRRHDGRLIHERVTGVVLEALSGGFAASNGAKPKETDEAESPGVTDTRKGWF